jgi:hypothetical protein
MPWDGIDFDPATGENTLARVLLQQRDGDKVRVIYPKAAAAPDHGGSARLAIVGGTGLGLVLIAVIAVAVIRRSRVAR